MGKYEGPSDTEYDYDRNYYLHKIANELAETNRLKRIEMGFLKVSEIAKQIDALREKNPEEYWKDAQTMLETHNKQLEDQA